MASGHALTEHKRSGRKVVIVTKSGKPRWDELWRGLPWIVQPGEEAGDALRLRNGPQCRPYIRYPFTRKTGCTFSGWRARDHVGAIALTKAEMERAGRVRQETGPFILIEPHVPPQSNPNKQWGWANWQALADILRGQGRTVAQFRLPGVPMLERATPIETSSFREGAAVLALAEDAILPEGGMHHAAGVLRRHAVVLFGGVVDVEATGYPWHSNIVDTSEASPCGRWEPCDHCADIWRALSPEAVAARLDRQT